MNDHDDTKTRIVTPVAWSPDGGRFLARTESGEVLKGATYEYVVEHCPEVLEDPAVEFVSLASPPPSRAHDGPPRVTTDAYRDGWERIFGRGKATTGEA